MKLTQALESKFPVSQRATKASPSYPADDGALKLVQLRQIKKTAAKSNPKHLVRTSLLDVSTA
jgi:transposase-like protein